MLKNECYQFIRYLTLVILELNTTKHCYSFAAIKITMVYRALALVVMLALVSIAGTTFNQQYALSLSRNHPPHPFAPPYLYLDRPLINPQLYPNPYQPMNPYPPAFPPSYPYPLYSYPYNNNIYPGQVANGLAANGLPGLSANGLPGLLGLPAGNGGIGGTGGAGGVAGNGGSNIIIGGLGLWNGR